MVPPGPLRLRLGAGPVPGSLYPGHDDPGYDDPGYDPDPGSYSGTEFPGPDYPAPRDHSSSRAHVAWGRERDDEPGEDGW